LVCTSSRLGRWLRIIVSRTPAVHRVRHRHNRPVEGGRKPRKREVEAQRIQFRCWASVPGPGPSQWYWQFSAPRIPVCRTPTVFLGPPDRRPLGLDPAAVRVDRPQRPASACCFVGVPRWAKRPLTFRPRICSAVRTLGRVRPTCVNHHPTPHRGPRAGRSTRKTCRWSHGNRCGPGELRPWPACSAGSARSWPFRRAKSTRLKTTGRHR